MKNQRRSLWAGVACLTFAAAITAAAQQDKSAKDKDAAEKLLGVGSFKTKPELDKSEMAAWATVASMILNLDETVTKN